MYAIIMLVINMKNKGFTLIEVLAVVIILALFALILVPKANSIIKGNKIKACNSVLTTIESSAEQYLQINYSSINGMIESNGYAEVTIETLIDAGLLEKNLTNPMTSEPIARTSIVRIYNNGASYNYEVMGVECK